MIIVRIKSHSELLHERLINFLSLFFFHSPVCMAPTMFVSSVWRVTVLSVFTHFIFWFFFLLFEEKAALHSSWFSLCKISFFVQPFFFLLLNLLAGYDGRWTEQQGSVVNKWQKKQPANTNKATSFLSWWLCLNSVMTLCKLKVHVPSQHLGTCTFSLFIVIHEGLALRIYTPQISAETEMRFRQSSVQNNLLTLENIFKLTLNAQD